MERAVIVAFPGATDFGSRFPGRWRQSWRWTRPTGRSRAGDDHSLLVDDVAGDRDDAAEAVDLDFVFRRGGGRGGLRGAGGGEDGGEQERRGREALGKSSYSTEIFSRVVAVGLVVKEKGACVGRPAPSARGSPPSTRSCLRGAVRRESAGAGDHRREPGGLPGASGRTRGRRNTPGRRPRTRRRARPTRWPRGSARGSSASGGGARSARAMAASRPLRHQVRSAVSQRFLASCWVIVEPRRAALRAAPVPLPGGRDRLPVDALVLPERASSATTTAARGGARPSRGERAASRRALFPSRRRRPSRLEEGRRHGAGRGGATIGSGRRREERESAAAREKDEAPVRRSGAGAYFRAGALCQPRTSVSVARRRWTPRSASSFVRVSGGPEADGALAGGEAHHLCFSSQVARRAAASRRPEGRTR